MQIRYSLFKHDNALTFQVESQSPVVTCYLKQLGGYEASNGWTVKSHFYPGIDMESKTIFVRGSNLSMDTRPDAVWGMDTEGRDATVAEVYSAIQEFLRFARDEEEIKLEYPTFKQSEFMPLSNVQYISL